MAKNSCVQLVVLVDALTIIKTSSRVSCLAHFVDTWEMFQVLTLKQTGKVQENLPVILFGKAYWESIINWQVSIATHWFQRVGLTNLSFNRT